MQNTPNLSLLEPITHETQSRPFSIHNTLVNPDIDLVLYLHWHNEIEFLYIKSGEALFYVEEIEYHLREGDAIFIPPSCLHMAKQMNKSHCDFYAIVFSSLLFSDINPVFNKYLEPVFYNNLPCSLKLTNSIPWQKKLLNHLEHIINLNHQNIDEIDLDIRGTLMIMWQQLYNNHLSKIKVPENYRRLSMQLNESIKYIHELYYTDITLSTLADISYFSREQFCRSFKQLTGMTPFNYLNRFRILKSCEYLINTSKKTTDIAVLCGFNNISYFNRVFMRFIKMSPTSYRKIREDRRIKMNESF